MSHFEKQIRTQRTLGSRRRFLNLCVESLETRTLLSTVSAALNTASDPSHIGVVFGTKVAVVGQADPGSLVRLARNSGCQASPVRADAQGDYRLNVRLKLGVDVLQITAADQIGRAHV